MRERREAEETEKRLELEKCRAENRRAAIAESVAAVKAETPEVYAGRSLVPALSGWVKNFTGKQWLVLEGAIGTGKTTQGWSAALELAKRGAFLSPAETTFGWGVRPFAVWNTVRWLDALRISYDSDTVPPDLVYPWLLMLDDVGAERIRRDSQGGSWAIEQFYNTIHQRWERQRPTIVTTNLHGGELVKHLDERIADRIFDKRLTTVITLTGESWRRRIPEATP